MPRAQIGDVQLHYEVHGEGAETIVFVNGIAMTVQSWLPQRQHFAPRYRCLFHDTRGQLLSDKPAMDYSLELHAADLKALLDRLEIEDAHLVGTSYGGEIAMIFAYTYPERTRSLSVITSVSELDAVLRTGTESWAVAAQHGPTCLFRVMLPWTYSASFLAAAHDQLEQRARAMERVPEGYCEAFVRLVRAFSRLDITTELSRIRCPTLVLAAERDLIKPPRFSHLIHERIAGSRFEVIPGAGHAVVIEQPAEVNRLLDEFLAGVRG